MTAIHSNPISRSQHGVALIIALILLMVLTMIAVVAMRTTTLDLKMTTNQTIGKRTFQISEAGRTRIHDVLDDHSFYRGWPIARGGDVPVTSGFVVPPDIELFPSVVPLPNFYLTPVPQNWVIDPLTRNHLKFRIDEDGDSAYTSMTDMSSDVYISRIAAVAAPGSDTSQVSGYEGLGGGAAGAGSHLYYRIIADATGTGASASRTDANYRYVVTN